MLPILVSSLVFLGTVDVTSSQAVLGAAGSPAIVPLGPTIVAGSVESAESVESLESGRGVPSQNLLVSAPNQAPVSDYYYDDPAATTLSSNGAVAAPPTAAFVAPQVSGAVIPIAVGPATVVTRGPNVTSVSTNGAATVITSTNTVATNSVNGSVTTINVTTVNVTTIFTPIGSGAASGEQIPGLDYAYDYGSLEASSQESSTTVTTGAVSGDNRDRTVTTTTTTTVNRPRVTDQGVDWTAIPLVNNQPIATTLPAFPVQPIIVGPPISNTFTSATFRPTPSTVFTQPIATFPSFPQPVRTVNSTTTQQTTAVFPGFQSASTTSTTFPSSTATTIFPATQFTFPQQSTTSQTTTQTTTTQTTSQSASQPRPTSQTTTQFTFPQQSTTTQSSTQFPQQSSTSTQFTFPQQSTTSQSTQQSTTTIPRATTTQSTTTSQFPQQSTTSTQQYTTQIPQSTTSTQQYTTQIPLSTTGATQFTFPQQSTSTSSQFTTRPLSQSTSTSSQSSTISQAGTVFFQPPRTAGNCLANEHACPCATGTYCLYRAAACLNPLAACPAEVAGTPAPGSSADVTVNYVVPSAVSVNAFPSVTTATSSTLRPAPAYQFPQYTSTVGFPQFGSTQGSTAQFGVSTNFPQTTSTSFPQATSAFSTAFPSFTSAFPQLSTGSTISPFASPVSAYPQFSAASALPLSTGSASFSSTPLQFSGSVSQFPLASQSTSSLAFPASTLGYVRAAPALPLINSGIATQLPAISQPVFSPFQPSYNFSQPLLSSGVLSSQPLQFASQTQFQPTLSAGTNTGFAQFLPASQSFTSSLSQIARPAAATTQFGSLPLLSLAPTAQPIFANTLSG